MQETSKSAMVRDINRYAGDIIAMVVADTRQQARDAAELIEMDFEPLDAVTDVYAAMRDDAPCLHQEYKNNIDFEWHAGRIADAREALDNADGSAPVGC